MANVQRVRRGERRGAVTASVAVSLLAIMGVAAVALEGGILQSERRRAQAVAGSAALARAVARGISQSTLASILVLSKTAAPALTMTGGAILVAPGAVVVDSSSAKPAALNVGGTGTSLTGSEVDVVGDISGSNVYAPTA